MQKTVTPTLQTEKLPLKEKIAYGMGDLGNNFLYDLGQIYLLKFYTDIMGLPAVMAGLVFLVTKLFDAFADISVGTWVDSRKRGIGGKFRPFMIYGALPLGLMTIVSFINPGFATHGNLYWAYFTYMLFGLLYSIVNIPYGSMASSMTQDPNERAQLGSFRQAGSNAGLLITTVAFIPIVNMFSNHATGYLAAATFFAICGTLIFIYSAKNINERVVVEKAKEAKVSIGKSFAGLLKNKPLIILCFINLLTFSAFNVKLAVQVYYCQYVLKDISILPYMGFFSIGCVFLGVAAVPAMVRRFGKKGTYMMGCAIWAVGDILNFVFSSTTFSFIALSCVAFFGTAFVNSLNWACVADAVEYGEWKTGNRSEGIVYSSFTFFRKTSSALAGFLPGVVLGYTGYVANAVQSASAVAGIKGLMFLYSGTLVIVAIFVMGLWYPLSDKRYREILAELIQRKTNNTIES